ncbi:DUF3617 domain-containing protein [Sandarakinorhabdus rubra]|uniref:DUF3617 domain-containing protein n=1 Tax=Sandarakinorhabdus rubra TaxID=2672568 RepID=UPI0013DC8DA6|nr:DUF3617 domain-containing protein [Sandarakinorhabdus rubra]
MRAVLMLVAGVSGTVHAAESPVTPGKWQTTTMVQSMTIPNMPPEMARRMMGKPINTTICITPKDAAAGPRDVIAKSNGACRYRSFSAAAGRISAVMECKAGTPTPQVIAIAGSYGPTAYDIRSKMSGGAVQSVSRTLGKRLGPC